MSTDKKEVLDEDEFFDDDAFFNQASGHEDKNGFKFEDEFQEDEFIEEEANIFDSTEFNPQNNNAQGANNRGTNQANQQSNFQGGVNNNYQNTNQDGGYQNAPPVNTRTEPSKSKKIVGITIFVVMILIAGMLVLFSKVKITHDTNTTASNNQQTTQAKEQQNQANNPSVADTKSKRDLDLEKQNSDLSDQVKDLQDKIKTLEEEQTKQASSDVAKGVSGSSSNSSANSTGKITIPKDTNSNNASGVGNWQEVSGDDLDYSGQTLKTTGTVSDKRVFLNDSGQLIYVIEISGKMNGVSTGSVDYYCGYDAFTSVKLNEKVDVSYKKINNNVFAVLGVTK